MEKTTALILVLALLIVSFFSSCQKEEILESPLATPTKVDHSNQEAASDRISSSSIFSRDLICHTGDQDCNASPFGGCLILFPEDGNYADPININHSRGLSFVNNNNELNFYLFNDMPISPATKNTTQNFTIHQDLVVPATIANDIYDAGTSPGEITLSAGTYSAQVGENHTSLSVPSSAGDVAIVIWSNETINASEINGFLHNKWMADILRQNIDHYNTLGTVEEIHTEVRADMMDFSSEHNLGTYDLSSVSISGQSSVEMIEAMPISAYEKTFLSNFATEVSETDIYSVAGLSDALAIINSYEAAASNDASIANQEMVAGFLATTKHSAIHWNIVGKKSGESTRISRGWWTVICDAIGFGIGFLGGGPVGGPITGVATSVVGYLTYNHFF